MSSIALYAGKLNQMSSLIGNVRRELEDCSADLFSLKSGMLNVSKSVCDLDDVIAAVQTSTEIQEQEIASFDVLSQKNGDFIADVIRIDNDVAGAVNQRKDDFYGQYSWLKPDSEKNGLKDICQKVGEWCKEHWKEAVKILTVVILTVTSIALLCTGVGGILAAACWGCIYGILGGALFNGVLNLFQGKNFWDGALDAVFYGAVCGVVGGAIGGKLVSNLPFVTSLGEAVWRGIWTGMVSGAGSSFVTGTVQYFDTYGFSGTMGDYFEYVGSSVLSGAVIGGAIGGVTGGIGFKVGQIRTNNKIAKELGKATSNKEKGTLFEKMGHEQISNNPKYIDSDTQIKMNLNGGTQKGGTSIFMDEVAITKDGVVNFEFKSSNSAGFTNYSNTKGGGQTAAYVDNGFKLSAPAYLTNKGIALTGTNVLPQNMPVTVVRPGNFVSTLGVMKDGIQTMFLGMSPGLAARVDSALD